MLRRSCGKTISSVENRLNDLGRTDIRTIFNGLPQAVFAPFLIRGIHRFTHTVCEKNDQISWMQVNLSAFVPGLGKQSHRGPTGLEPNALGGTVLFAQNDRRIVSRIDVAQTANSRVVLSVEESCIPIDRGSFRKQGD